MTAETARTELLLDFHESSFLGYFPGDTIILKTQRSEPCIALSASRNGILRTWHVHPWEMKSDEEYIRKKKCECVSVCEGPTCLGVCSRSVAVVVNCMAW